MAKYTYITLNDGTQWRIKGNVQPQTGSGPYRNITTRKNTDTEKSTSAGAAAQKAAAEARAVREAELAAERKERQRKEKIAAINNSKKQELLQLGDSYAAQKNAAKLASDDNMRELYIAYMQGLRGIPQQSALWGAGGEIESLKNRSRINYEENRARESRSYAGILGEIEKKYNDDLRALETKYLQRLLDI